MNSDDQSSTDSPVQAFDADAYNATREVVRRRLTILEKSQDELKLQKEMIANLFENDPQYQEADSAVKEVTKKKIDEKARIIKTPGAQSILSKVKALQDEIKGNKEMLSTELMQYYQTAGVTEIEDSEGNIQEFEINIKLKGKRKTS